MLRVIIMFLLTTFSLLFASSLDSQITKKKKELTAKKVEYKKMDKELSYVAKKIIRAKKEKAQLDKKLASLESSIKKNKKKNLKLQKKDKVVSKDLLQVNNSLASNQEKFLELVSKNFSMALALEEVKQPTKESVVLQEVYEVYAKKNKKQIDTLKEKIFKLEKKKTILLEESKVIQGFILKYNNAKIEFIDKKKKKEAIITILARDKAIYRKRFERIKKSRRKLERKLAKLQIIRREKKAEIKAKKMVEQNRVALARAEDENKNSSSEFLEVADTSNVHYSGRKTISPLKGSRLIKKFGTYIDPIYKFKIFNKSITLKSPYAGAKVRTILKGKIVFAENSGGMLGKVVIVEHANGIHTIYAKLSRLAPGIRVGKQLRKADTIGKVEKSLMFEVTKDNQHINPLKLIRL